MKYNLALTREIKIKIDEVIFQRLIYPKRKRSQNRLVVQLFKIRCKYTLYNSVTRNWIIQF